MMFMNEYGRIFSPDEIDELNYLELEKIDLHLCDRWGSL